MGFKLGSNDSPPHLSPNLRFNLQIKMPKRKSRSETGLLNTLQVEIVPKVHYAHCNYQEEDRQGCLLGSAVACCCCVLMTKSREKGVILMENLKEGEGDTYVDLKARMTALWVLSRRSCSEFFLPLERFVNTEMVILSPSLSAQYCHLPLNKRLRVQKLFRSPSTGGHP